MIKYLFLRVRMLIPPIQVFDSKVVDDHPVNHNFLVKLLINKVIINYL